MSKARLKNLLLKVRINEAYLGETEFRDGERER